MTSHAIWYWQNTFANLTTQSDVHIGSLSTTGRILEIVCHGEFSGQSGSPGLPYVIVNDVIWGIQWVPSGGAPLDIIISAPSDQWFWRHMVSANNDGRTAVPTPTGTVTVQGVATLNERYRGQGIQPGGAIDVYVSFKSVFGLNASPVFTDGSVDGIWS